jgi:AAA+ superfamily predicted ATPase
MDDGTLGSLRVALRATPDNLALLAVVVRALRDRGDVAGLLEHLRPGAELARCQEAEARASFADALVRVGRPAEALVVAHGDTPEERVARAKALAAQERGAEAKAEYERAIAENRTLEDPALAAQLTARTPATAQVDDGRPRFRVIDGGGDEAVDALFAPPAPRITFADVGGLAELKAQITRRIILPFQKPSLFERFKRKSGGGILMFGPPGVGKTMLARATAGECNAEFVSVAISDVLDMYIGESEAKLHAIFERARAKRPTVLFFDEIEALGGKRQYARDSSSSKLVSQFLAEMDGFAQNNAGVLVLGATNVPWAVDSAFRRPGRFDRSFFVPPPDREARRMILDLKLRSRPVAGTLDLDAIAKATSSFSGADLEHVVDTAADLAIAASLSTGVEVPITQAHLQAALRETKPTTVEWLTTARNHARYANEAGQYDEVLEFLDKHGRS